MSKKNIILGIILIVLAVFAWLWSGPLKDWQKNNGQEKNFLAAVDPAKIDKITINKAGQTTELDKSGDSWTLSGMKNFHIDPTAAGALNSVLNEIGTLPIETASANAQNKSLFGTDDRGLKVEIKQGAATFDFIAGKSSADGAATYLAPPDSDKTYQIALDLNGIFGRDEWRDSQIFSFAPERAEKIRFQYPASQFIVSRVNNVWAGSAPYKFSVSADKISGVLSVLQNLTAVKIPAQIFTGTGLEKHSVIVQVTGEGIDNTIMIGDCIKDNLCYAKTAASDNIYLISKSDRDALNKKITDLK
ncbi:MAG TPA: DUF4340 domain-containing protein [Candidatus Nanoarchaeia archaeon]|nr:DUF4340 domain-containing protein [Candidatus Nanoarchaeia archaeon]